MTKEFNRHFNVRWSEVGAANRVTASKYMEYLVERGEDGLVNRECERNRFI